jgi:fluoroacetyl-CoA thioesterase
MNGCGYGSRLKAGTTVRFVRASDHPMDARDFIRIGMSAERMLVVPPERTVGHFVPHMPMVYATPMMILEMEMTSGDAINKFLEPGWVTLGTEVDIRHLAATAVGMQVRTTAQVIAVERRVIRFEVEAFSDTRRIGEGRHARGLVNVEAFTKRLAAHTQSSS